ncbi:MAG: molybdenum cofactor guanylyltransferase [Nitrospinae bacterium]|nr:molybdenum cofactor guanylyltransferase [Nitrospinota bacterium]
MTVPALVVALLAGGGSRRMGKDKAFVEFDGRPMIGRVIDAVEEAGLPLVIIAPRTQDYLSLGRPVYEDLCPGMGPLSGLHTAFAVTGAERILLLACDMPGVRPALLGFLAGRGMGDADALIPFIDGREQGLLAVYGRGGVERVAAEIEAGIIQFDAFRRRLTVERLGEELLRPLDPSLASFANLNRPADVDDWRRSHGG